MLTKTQIAQSIAAETGLGVNAVKHVLDDLAALVADHVAEGEDIVIPGICRISYTYRAPQKKGAKYKKGATYVGFGGVEQVAEEDSKPVTEQVKLRAAPAGALARLKPGSKPEDQKLFLGSRAGKAVRKRKAK